MNYQHHYDLLIQRAQNRARPDCYIERHHVTPRHLGGDNSSDNLVRLTASEHFVAHLLLTRMHPDNGGLATAAYLMANKTGKPLNNKMYSRLKEMCVAVSIMNGKTTGKANGKIAGAQAVARGTGIHKQTKEQLSALGKQAAIRGVGAHAMSSEQHAEQGRNTKARGIGVHAQTPEQLSALGRITNTQRWRCQQCDMVTNPGNLGKHQTASGHVGRVKLS